MRRRKEGRKKEERVKRTRGTSVQGGDAAAEGVIFFLRKNQTSNTVGTFRIQQLFWTGMGNWKDGRRERGQ